MRGEYKVPGGKLVAVDLDVADGVIASAAVSGEQTMPQVLRMMKAIFSGVQSEAATMRSPSFSRSSSSVTMTISPLVKASMAAET